MALDGPYTIDDLLAMTGQKPRKAAPVLRAGVVTLPGTRARNMRLLGIDPGTRCVGWGVVEVCAKSGTLSLFDCGYIAPGNALELRVRLREIFAELEEIITRIRPDAAALEETFAGVNMKSAIAMGEGRGVALLALARADLDVLELSPRSIKKAVTGSGASSKTQVATMVAAQLNIKKAPQPEDVTDALAAAIALARRL